MVVVLKNRQILLKDYVTGNVTHEDMVLHTTTLPLVLEYGSKDVLVKNLFLSVDPYMRRRMTNIKGSYIHPFTPGKAMSGLNIAKVMLSNNPDFHEGDLVQGMLGWEEYSIVSGGAPLTKIHASDLPLTYYLGVLGLPGLTAYAGFYRICEPKKGEKVFISAASGAVGQLVGQFAKLEGCHVGGSVGSQEKVDLIKTQFGFDDAFNYKEETDFRAALKRCFPEGIDIYFDNVGGKMLEAVLDNMRDHGRVCVCGMISQSNLVQHEGIHNLIQLILKRIKMQGFLMSDYSHLYPHFIQEVSSHLREGKIKYVEDITVGLENAPSALIGILKGDNIGKKIVKLS